jgi:hypothetical protein
MHMLVHNKYVLFNMHGMNIKVTVCYCSVSEFLRWIVRGVLHCDICDCVARDWMFRMQFGFSASPPLKCGQVLYSSSSWDAKPTASLLTAPNMHLAQLHRPSCPCLAIVWFSSRRRLTVQPTLEICCLPLKCTPGSLYYAVVLWLSFILTSVSATSWRPRETCSA